MLLNNFPKRGGSVQSEPHAKLKTSQQPGMFIVPCSTSSWAQPLVPQPQSPSRAGQPCGSHFTTRRRHCRLGGGKIFLCLVQAHRLYSFEVIPVVSLLGLRRTCLRSRPHLDISCQLRQMTDPANCSFPRAETPKH